MLQLTCKLLYYSVAFVILKHSSLLRIDGIPVSWLYSRNRRSRGKDMLRSLQEGSNLKLFFLKYLLPFADFFLWAPGEI